MRGDRGKRDAILDETGKHNSSLSLRKVGSNTGMASNQNESTSTQTKEQVPILNISEELSKAGREKWGVAS